MCLTGYASPIQDAPLTDEPDTCMIRNVQIGLICVWYTSDYANAEQCWYVHDTHTICRTDTPLPPGTPPTPPPPEECWYAPDTYLIRQRRTMLIWSDTRMIRTPCACYVRFVISCLVHICRICHAYYLNVFKLKNYNIIVPIIRLKVPDW